MRGGKGLEGESRERMVVGGGGEGLMVLTFRQCVLYIGQVFRYSPENAFYIFNQQI